MSRRALSAVRDAVPRLPGRWHALAAGMAVQAVVATLQQGLPALGPYLRGRFALSLAELGALLTCSSWGAILTLYLWGRLADHWGERSTVTIGLAAAAAGLAAIALVESALSLGLLLLLAGAASAAAISGTGRAVMSWFPRDERGFALGLRQMSIPLGAALSAAVLPLLAIRHGIGTTMLALAAIFALAALIAALGLRAPPAPVGTAAMAQATRPATPLGNPALWRVSVASGVLQWTQVALLGFLVVILVERSGLDYPAAAGLFALTVAASGLLRVLFGLLSDRIGHRVPLLCLIAVALGAILLAAGACLAADAAAARPVLVLATVLSLSWNGLAFTAVAEIAGPHRAGTALGLHGTLMRVLTIPTAIAIGWIAGAAGWAVAVSVLAVFAIASAALLIPYARSERAQAAASHHGI